MCRVRRRPMQDRRCSHVCSAYRVGVEQNRYARLHHRWQTMLYNFVLRKQQSMNTRQPAPRRHPPFPGAQRASKRSRECF
eukprot:5048108-Amphidinium_carterae.1